MSIKTLIVDDERVTRRRILSLLKTDSEIEVIGECGDGPAAVRAISESKPDLVFLDVQMPEMTGFDVLQAIPREHLPATIFVTAFDHYTVKAFEAHALDYLLKPFAVERFSDAISRAKRNLNQTASPEKGNLVEMLREMRGPRRSIMVRTGGRTVFIRLDEIEWIEAAANYVKIHAGEEQYVVREKISTFEQQLPDLKFVRIHRSLIAGIDHVRELQACGNGEFVVVLRRGKELPLGRTFRSHVDTTMKRAHAIAV
jgi:two-component system LytT family response regulator